MTGIVVNSCRDSKGIAIIAIVKSVVVVKIAAVLVLKCSCIQEHDSVPVSSVVEGEKV